jgi:hypothetical protein
MLGHLSCWAGIQLETLPEDPASDKFLNVIFNAVADIDDLSGRTGGPTVAVVLGRA